MSGLPSADLTTVELERFRRFEKAAAPVFKDVVSAHVWLAKFSPRIGGGTITRREAIRESEKGLLEVLLELQAVCTGNGGAL